MNKRGQMYILAAILLSIAIYSVMKVTNKIEEPSDDNFDFLIENLEGEKAYVTDLGLIGEDNLAGSSGSLLDVFTRFGLGTGIVLVQNLESGGYRVYNYLGKEIITDCENCGDRLALQSGLKGVADLTFELGQGGKRFNVVSTDLVDIADGSRYFSVDYPNVPDIEIDGNTYDFSGDVTEAIVFKNLGKDYVKVVRL